METGWVAIIVAVVSLVGSVSGSLIGNRKNTAVLEEQVKHIGKDVSEIQTKLDKHNHFGERLGVVETGLKNVCQRVDKLEK